MTKNSMLGGILMGLLVLVLACGGGGGGGGPTVPDGTMVGSWQATHTLTTSGFPFGTCSGPLTVTNATSTSFSGTFSIMSGQDCEGSAQFTFTGTRVGNQATLTVSGPLLEELLAVCEITAGDAFWTGTASNTRIDVARNNTIACTDPEDDSVIVVDIRWELAAQKTG